MKRMHNRTLIPGQSGATTASSRWRDNPRVRRTRDRRIEFALKALAELPHSHSRVLTCVAAPADWRALEPRFDLMRRAAGAAQARELVGAWRLIRSVLESEAGHAGDRPLAVFSRYDSEPFVLGVPLNVQQSPSMVFSWRPVVTALIESHSTPRRRALVHADPEKTSLAMLWSLPVLGQRAIARSYRTFAPADEAIVHSLRELDPMPRKIFVTGDEARSREVTQLLQAVSGRHVVRLSQDSELQLLARRTLGGETTEWLEDRVRSEVYTEPSTAAGTAAALESIDRGDTAKVLAAAEFGACYGEAMELARVKALCDQRGVPVETLEGIPVLASFGVLGVAR